MASRGIKLRQSYRPYREDKNNPLGPWIIHLTFDKRDTLRGLHGTKDPLSIGKAATMGCFRVYNEAIEYIVRSGLIRRGDNILFR